MKIFANKNIFKKIILAVLLLLSFSFVSPEPVEAGIGGELMQPICDFLLGLGDGVVSIIHNVVLKQERTAIRIDLNTGILGILKIVACVAAFVLATVAVVVITGGIGVGLSALKVAIAGGTVMKFGAAVANSLGTVVVLSIVGGGWAAAKTSDKWFNNEVVLPLYTITPEEIFKNNEELPLFDVNFFEPNEGTVKYSYDVTKVKVPEKIKNAEYTNVITTAPATEIDNKMKSDKNINMNTTEFYKQAIVEQLPEKSLQVYYRQINKRVYRLIYDTTNLTYSVAYTAGDISSEYSGEIHSFSQEMSGIVATWYRGIRIIAIVGMMSVLVYIGIRILISSTSTQKAKYKQLLGDWLVGMLLLFSMHYIMVFSNKFVTSLTGFLDNIQPNVFVRGVVDTDGKVSEELGKSGLEVVDVSSKDNTKSVNTSSDGKVAKYKENDVEFIEWDTNLMGMIRMEAQAQSEDDLDKYIGYTIMFLVMVFYTLFFAWTYTKRLIYMAFLTIIAPLVALTYPIDKANDGKAQGFDYWFKEYIFNLLLQPMHLLIYTILVSTAMQLAGYNWIYSLVALGFIASAEKIVRTMFNFSKASTPGVFAGPAGAALTMTGIRWLIGHGPKGGNSGSGNAGKGKNELSSGDKNVGYSTGSNKVNMRNILGVSTNTTPTNPANNPPAGANDSQTGGINLNVGIGGNSQGDNSSGTGSSQTSTGNNGNIRQIRRPQRRRLNALASTSQVYGRGIANKLSRSLENANPIRSIGKLGAGAISGATLGMVGLSAGIASGDASKAFQYAGAGIAGGYKLGTGAFDSASNALTVEGLGDEYERNVLGEKEYQKRKAEKNKREYKSSEEHINALRQKNNWSRDKAEEFLNGDFVDKCLENNITDINDINDLRKVMENEHRTHTIQEPTGEFKPVMGKRKRKTIDKKTGEKEPVYRDKVIDDGAWNEDELIATFNTNKALFGGAINTNKDTMNKMEVTLKDREYKDTNDPDRFASETINRIEGLQKSLNRVKGNI